MANSEGGPRIWFLALRPFAFPSSVLPVLIGTASVAPIREWRWLTLAVALPAILLLHSMANLLNDYFDFRSGTDTRTENDDGRPGRYLVRGVLSCGDILRLTLGCAVFLAPVAAWLLWHGGWVIGALLLFGLAAGYTYTAPPFALKRRGMGEAVILLTFGPALGVGAAFMQSRSIGLHSVFLSMIPGLLTTAVLASNYLRDLEEDHAADVRTLAVRLGRTRYRWLFAALLATPPLLVVIYVATDIATPWILLSLAGTKAAVIPGRDGILGIRKPNADKLTARYMLAFGGLLLLGLAIGGPR